MLGHISVSKKRFDEAAIFYNAVLKIEPWNKDAREKLDQLTCVQRVEDGRLEAEDSSVGHPKGFGFKWAKGTESKVSGRDRS